MLGTVIKTKISKILVTALLSLGIVSIPVSTSTALTVGSTNTSLTTLGANTGMLIASENSTSAAVIATTGATETASTAARSFNLKYSDNATPATGLAQVATVLTGGALSIYAAISTSAAISATGGTISATAHAANVTSTLTSGSTGVAYSLPGAALSVGTAVAAIWTAPSSAGTYTISISYAGTTGATKPSSTNPLAGYEVGSIFVNVVADSHPAVDGTNVTETLGAINNSLFVAVASNTTGASVPMTVSHSQPGIDDKHLDPRSLGLLYKDSTYRTAQSATVLASGQLSLYAVVSTTVAFTASGGTFSSTPLVAQGSFTETYGSNLRTALLTGPTANSYATSIGIIWSAPSVAGTYTVSLYAADGTSAPTLDTPAVSLAGNITVTVVASAAAAGPVVANSTCSVFTSATATPAAADTSSAFSSGDSAYINMQLKDAYNSANTTNGNFVVTATGDAVVNIGTTSVTAGTANTIVGYGNGSSTMYSVRVGQATAGAPVTTTVTVAFNGATICTKTITIRGVPASMAITNVSSVESNGQGAATAYWLADGTNRDAHMYITLKDSAGNTVLPGTNANGVSSTGQGEFAIAAASVSLMVTGFVVEANDQATSVSSSVAAWNASAAKYTCANGVNGTQKVTVNHTSAASGKVISATFDARCAGDAYTYTASFDKASYVQGEIATLTVKFLDSKGNAANSVTPVGTSTMTVPMLTFVTATGVATAITKADGTIAYTLQVGKANGLTNGTYNAIIDFSNLTAVAATTQTVAYKVSTGSTDVEFAEVLKSVVALIASINKQIQALQKLILNKRR